MNKTTLQELFKDMEKKKEYYADSATGEEFEQKFRRKLKAFGFSEIIQRSNTKTSIVEISELHKGISKKQILNSWKKMKTSILAKNSVELVKNPFCNMENMFIFQPFGTQQFPDFLIFTKEHILAIESKYKKNPNGKVKLSSAKPKWNSNMPKPNAIYLFGVASETITFFIGSDIIEYETRQVLLNFFEDLNKNEEKLNNELKGKKNNFGFYPYVRKDYNQKAMVSTYKNKRGKEEVEPYFSDKATDREQNVIDFLENI